MDEHPEITADELARIVDGRLAGDGRLLLRDVATLEEAGPHDLSWVGSPAHMTRLAKSRAGVVLIPAECAPPPGRTVISVTDPDLAVCRALEALAPQEEVVPPGVAAGARVAQTAQVAGACIAAGATVGAGARVGPGTQIHTGVWLGPRVQIGQDCVLWPNVFVARRTVIGDRVVIHPNVTIGADGFGYLQRDGRHVKIPQIGRVLIEDDVEIGANTCIDRARSGETRIGRGTKIDNLVQIAHNVTIGEKCIVVSQCGISGSTVLGNHVVLGGQVGLRDHVRVGDGAMVAGKSGVSHNLAGGKAYRGVPAVENARYMSQEIGVRRLPRLMAQLKALAKRVEELESAANDTARD
jgi:UDP-3-O-[3-hydroxymyristoyl] glucosamine N-acyltransferase